MPEGVVEGEHGTDVPDGVLITQTGQVNVRRRGEVRYEYVFSFRSGLRADPDEDYLSAIAGKVSVEVAVPLVCPGDSAGSADAVRYALPEDLRHEGFGVTYERSDTLPGHVAIRWPGEWEEEVIGKLDRCFRDCVRG